jgi:hypothetical protein
MISCQAQTIASISFQKNIFNAEAYSYSTVKDQEKEATAVKTEKVKATIRRLCLMTHAS